MAVKVHVTVEETHSIGLETWSWTCDTTWTSFRGDCPYFNLSFPTGGRDPLLQNTCWLFCNWL